jgi:hypothetical protein
VKADKAKALAMFNNGEGGFKDRDLYPFCFNSGDGKVNATAAKNLIGTDVRALKDKTGKAFGEDLYRAAQKETVTEVSYMFPRPGTDTPVEKISFVHQGRRSGLRRRLLQIGCSRATISRRLAFAPLCSRRVHRGRPGEVAGCQASNHFPAPGGLDERPSECSTDPRRSSACDELADGMSGSVDAVTGAASGPYRESRFT